MLDKSERSDYLISRSIESKKSKGYHMILRQDLLDENSPDGLQVYQLTTETEVQSSHVYMEAQIFTPDSKRLVLHRAAQSHAPLPDPRHQYLLCDLENNGELSPLTFEEKTTAPCLDPTGTWLYYFVCGTETTPLKLNRVKLDGTERETLMVFDCDYPGTTFRHRGIYPLSTISPDGKRLVFCGKIGESEYGLTVIDLEKGSAELILSGPTWLNLHPQYTRNPANNHDIMIQESHNYRYDPVEKKIVNNPDGKGTDIHLIRDDGTNFRSLPWGRDGNEFCQGHQCWIGRTDRTITSTHTREPSSGRLIESLAAAADAGHLGLHTPGGRRSDLTRMFTDPYFYHFATDIAGKRLITDSADLFQGGRLFTADLGEPGEPASNWRYILSPKCSPYAPAPKGCHIHPFFSPDGRTAFFNSDESGIPQAFMICGI